MKRFTRLHSKLITIVAMLALLPAFAAAEDTPAKIAVFHLDGSVTEKPMGEMGFSFGNEPTTLKEMIDQFEAAKNDNEIRAILITVGRPQLGLAQIQELRQAIIDCGKPVYVHVDSLSTGIYALASAAKHICVTPTGDVWVMGFYMETPYLKNLLDKLHLEADFVHIGDYKSAGETLYRTEPSEPAEANMNWLLDGLYEALLKMIADGRFHGDIDKARNAVNNAPYNAEEALKAGLIDSVKFRQDLTAELKKKYGENLKFVHNYGAEGGPDLDFGNPFAIFQVFADMMKGEEKTKEPTIAIIHVEGTIVTGQEQPNPFGGSSGAFSTTIRKALDKAADDDLVKAVVLRVDSPGGSALASEIIYDAIQRIREKGKPVVASMGNVAASGGYYVSCGTDKIIADPATITASIGVVGGKIVTTEMWNSIGINWHAYQRGDSADLMANARKWNESERQRITDWMNEVYAVFKGHIEEHRKDKLAKPLDEMAGGRVFTGAQALNLGLVDELGTLDDAIEQAADLASIADYEIRVLPKPRGLFDFLRESLDGGQEEDSVSVNIDFAKQIFSSRTSLFEAVLPAIKALDPERTAILTQTLMRLNLIHSENVILMTPQDFLLRYN